MELPKKWELHWIFSEFETKWLQFYRLHFFNQYPNRRFLTCMKKLLECQILFLVPGSGNLIRWKCQKLHICMNLLDKQTRFFSKRIFRDLPSWFQSKNFVVRASFTYSAPEKSACIAAGKTRPNTGYWEYYTFESKSQRRFWAIHSNVDIVDIETLHRPQTWPHGHMATRPHGHTHGHRLRSCSQPADRIKQDQTGSNRLDLQLAGFSLWWSVWQGQSTTPSALRSTAHSWEVLDSARHFNQKWNDLGEP